MNKPRISIIAALSENRVIGVNNDLPWNIPGDLKRFKELTRNHPIIMGRKTFKSIGRVLPHRTNIIITREEKKFKDEADKLGLSPIFVVTSLDSALDLAKKSEGSDELFIIGGGQIFKEALDKGLVDRLYLTIIHKDYEGDVFFPDYSGFTKLLNYEKK